jgi:hypothetical protein
MCNTDCLTRHYLLKVVAVSLRANVIEQTKVKIGQAVQQARIIEFVCDLEAIMLLIIVRLALFIPASSRMFTPCLASIRFMVVLLSF